MKENLTAGQGYSCSYVTNGGAINSKRHERTIIFASLHIFQKKKQKKRGTVSTVALHNVLPYFTKQSIDNLSTVKPLLRLGLSYRLALVPTRIPQRYLKPARFSQHQAFCDREAAVACVCLIVLWTLGFFLILSLARGDRKPHRPQSLLLLFYISLLVTGLTSPRGTRGTERGWREKKRGSGKKG